MADFFEPPREPQQTATPPLRGALLRVKGNGKLKARQPLLLAGALLALALAFAFSLSGLFHARGLTASYQYLPDGVMSVKPASVPALALQPGLSLEIFKGNRCAGTAVQKRSFTLESFATDWSSFTREKLFAARMEGYLRLSQPGRYKVQLISDDGVRLYLSDKLLVDTWGMRGQQTGAATFECSEAGLFPVLLEYRQSGGGAYLQMDLARDEEPFRTVGVKDLCYNTDRLRLDQEALGPFPNATSLAGVPEEANSSLQHGFCIYQFRDPELTGACTRVEQTSTALEMRFTDGADQRCGKVMLGSLLFRKAGSYVLGLTSDDGSRLYLNGRLILNHWGEHPVSRRLVQVEVDSPGWIPFQIDYQNFGGEGLLRLTMARAGEEQNVVELQQLCLPPANRVAPRSEARLGPPAALPKGVRQGLQLAFFDGPYLGELPTSLAHCSQGVEEYWIGRERSTFSATYRGYVNFPKPGKYRLRVTSDDGSRVVLGESLRIENWGVHKPQAVEKEFAVERAGYYAFVLEYQNVGGGALLRVERAAEGEPFALLDASQFVYLPEQTPAQRLASDLARTTGIAFASTHFASPTIDKSYQIYNYVYGCWDHRLVDCPARMPSVLLQLRSKLSVPKSGVYEFKIDSEHVGALAIDGHAVCEAQGVALASGTHDLLVALRLMSRAMNEVRHDRTQAFQLLWKGPHADTLVPLERKNLRTPQAATPWVLATLFSLGGAVLLIALSRCLTNRCMALVMRRHWPLGALLCILVLAGGVKLAHVDTFPPVADSFDEQQEAFVGRSMLKLGRPVSWVWNVHAYCYPDSRIVGLFGWPFRISQCYLDHPPFYGILANLLTAQPPGEKFYEVNVLNMRRLNIVLASVNLILMFLIGRRVLAAPSLLLGLLIYAVFPFIALGSIMVKCDQLLTTLSLLALWFSMCYVERPRAGFLVGALLSAFLCVWAKETGIFAAALVFVYMLHHRRYGAALLGLGAGALAVGSWIGYGFWVSPQSFRMILAANTNRSVHWDIGLVLWNNLKVADYSFYPWIGLSVLLWIGLFSRLGHRGGFDLLSVAAMTYMLCLLASIHVLNTYGWYSLPLYPYLALSLGDYLCRSMSTGALTPFYVIVVFGCLFGFVGLYPEAGSLKPAVLRWLIVSMFGPMFLYAIFPRPALSRLLSRCAYATVYTTMFGLCLILIFEAYAWPY